MLPYQVHILSGSSFNVVLSGVYHVGTFIQCCPMINIMSGFSFIRSIVCRDLNSMLPHQGYIISRPLINVASSGVYYIGTFEFIQCCLIRCISCRDLHTMLLHQVYFMSELSFNAASSGIHYVGTFNKCCLIGSKSCWDFNAMLPNHGYIM